MSRVNAVKAAATLPEQSDGMASIDGVVHVEMEIHIFPEALRGTGEGHRPWDLMPNSTMTNA